MISECSKCA